MTIKHRAGKLNANADALSHNPCTVQDSCAVDDFSVDVCFFNVLLCVVKMSVLTSARPQDDVGAASVGMESDGSQEQSNVCVNP